MNRGPQPQPSLQQEVERIVGCFLEVFNRLNQLKDRLVNRMLQSQTEGRCVIPTNEEIMRQVAREFAVQSSAERSRDSTKKQRFMSLEGYRSKANAHNQGASRTKKISEFFVEEPVTHKILEQPRMKAVREFTPQSFARQPMPSKLEQVASMEDTFGSVPITKLVENMRTESDRFDRQILRESLEMVVHCQPTKNDPKESEMFSLIQNRLRLLDSSRRV